MSTTDHSTTWRSVRGTLLHRAVLHPATFARQVDTGDLRAQYMTYASDLATVIHASLDAADFTLARLVVSSGGPSWGTAVDDFRRLTTDDQARVLQGFETAAARMTHMLMHKAREDDWLWIQTEVSSPYAFVHGLAHKGCRIDAVAKRRSTGSDDAATLVVVDLKTGEDHSDASTANTYLMEVATKYGAWFATEMKQDTACMVMYARAEGGYSSWSDLSVVVHPDEVDLRARLALEQAYRVATGHRRAGTLDVFLPYVPTTISREMATAWYGEQQATAD